VTDKADSTIVSAVGDLGMDMVVQYLSTLDINLLPPIWLLKKLDGLEAELEIIS